MFIGEEMLDKSPNWHAMFVNIIEIIEHCALDINLDCTERSAVPQNMPTCMLSPMYPQNHNIQMVYI